MIREFLRAAATDLPKVQRMLREGVANVNEADRDGYTALWIDLRNSQFRAARWLVESGGADVHNPYIWSILEPIVNFHDNAAKDAELVGFLHVLLLRSDPPYNFGNRSRPRWRKLLQEGKQLRLQLPAYLAQRRALLDTHSPLIAPLCALVNDYMELTTTEELWATGLGTGFYNFSLHCSTTHMQERIMSIRHAP
jgi:hypothetical protein